MKTLYESILSSTGSGKKVMIEKWCQEHKPFQDHWIINKNLEIERSTNDGYDLILPFDTYSALPDYIQFADDMTLRVLIGTSAYMKMNIESLRGLPKYCRKLIIKGEIKELPAFEIKTCYFALHTPSLKKTGKIVIQMMGEGGSEDRVIRIKDMPYEEGKSFADLLPNLHVKGARQFDVMNCAYLGDTFSKLMNRKAEMNKYAGRFQFPVSNEALPLIDKYFGKNFDTSQLEEIIYTQNSILKKHKGTWYRCKNRR